MKYQLNTDTESMTLRQALGGFRDFIQPETRVMVLAVFTIIINATANVLAPYFIGRAVDVSIAAGDYTGLVTIIALLVVSYVVSSITGYANIVLMGRIGQRVLYRLRYALFQKMQFLPIAFFNQNKAGDLISRITNDTNTVNTLFAETLVRLLSNFFTIIGIAVFMLTLNLKLGLATISVSVGLFLVMRFANAFLQRVNKKALDMVGDFSADVQEHIENIKATIAYRRREYFVQTLEKQNVSVFLASRLAGVANSVISPLYKFAGQLSQVVILVYGLILLGRGEVTIGLLISYFAYAQKFFEPLRIIASLWASVQKAIAGWKRIVGLLGLEHTTTVAENTIETFTEKPVMEFDHVTFGYNPEETVISDMHFSVKAGETFAIVGPTGGGKSTTASLMMRLYEATSGEVRLLGRNIAEYSAEQISRHVSFILQDPVLFTGTVGQNIALGHPDFADAYDKEALNVSLKAAGFEDIVAKFSDGLATEVNPEQDSLSLGQQQLIAFMRAVLRTPDLLILDEATANVDTVTEQQLDRILDQVRGKTAIVIIAHRLNTIRNADEILFIQDGRAEKAESFDDAVARIDASRGDS
jgi:ATP-binding cassette subfamily B protein